MKIYTRIMSMAIVVSMILAGISLISAEADFELSPGVTTTKAPLPNGVIINDIAWMTTGELALAVGKNDTGGSNAYWYVAKNDTWVGLQPLAANVTNELVHGPAVGGETGPFFLANVPAVNGTLYRDDGTPTKLTQGVHYNINLLTGEINLLAPMNAGDKLIAYYNYSNQELNKVIWSDYHGAFGVVGDFVNVDRSSVLATYPYASTMGEVAKNRTWPNATLYGIGEDEWGNLLGVGANDAVYFYEADNEIWYIVQDDEIVNSGEAPGWTYYDVDYEIFYQRFYLVGDGVITYTEPIPNSTFIPGWHYDYDTVVNMSGFNALYSIDWNNNPVLGPDSQVAFAVGYEQLNTLLPIDIGINFYRGPSPGIVFKDVKFEETLWQEAIIIAHSTTGTLGIIYQYNAKTGGIKALATSSTQNYTSVDYRKPNSPPIAMVVGEIGGVYINLNSFDISTLITVSSDEPHIFGFDMWKKTDVTETSVLEKQIDVETTYSIGIQVNYTVGGVNKFWDNDNNTRISISAWYDEGQIGINSDPEGSWSTVENRTRQFRMIWYEGTSNSLSQGFVEMSYPVGSPTADEVTYLSHYVNPAVLPNDRIEMVFIGDRLSPPLVH